MEMLRRSSVFAAEVFDRSPTDKELVSQAKSLCRDYIHSRLNRAGIGRSSSDHGLAASGGTLGETSSVLLWLEEDLQVIPGNPQKNNMHSYCFITYVSLSGITWGKVVSLYAVAGALAVDCVRHGHPAMVHTIVDCMGEFVRKSLTTWLKRRGGWVDVTKCVVNTDASFHSHWLVTAACTFGHYLKAIVLYLLREK
nr:PREDICTED: bcl-2-related ovarian killer protein [Paralichthys olivaceus]